jgi:hypothetical protein
LIAAEDIKIDEELWILQSARMGKTSERIVEFSKSKRLMGVLKVVIFL